MNSTDFTHTSPRMCRRRKGGDASTRRAGKLLILVAVLLPSLFGIAGLVLDGGLMTVDSRRAQHAADAAATAAAVDHLWGSADPSITAETYVHDVNGMPAAAVTLHTPPTIGPFAGLDRYVEVLVNQPYAPLFAHLGGFTDLAVHGRAVAGLEPSTGPAAVVLLDPSPPQIHLGSLPVALPSVTPLLGGLEVLGLGRLRVNGAVLVNNEWGGLDERGEPVGSPGLRKACQCMVLLPLTRVAATDIRVAGGVDHPGNYGPLNPGGENPLRANRRPVPDPYRQLPAPTVATDPTNVSSTQHGGVTVVNLPLLQPPRVLQPGVYDWIQIVSGRVIFEPGVYVVRGVHPVTGIGLSILTGQIEARGVMFYLTNSTSYSVLSGSPDAFDGEEAPPGPSVQTLLPSALIDAGLLNSRFSGLDDPGSPFDGMLIYQRRGDRRPILIVQQALLGSPDFAGNVYAKWGHVVLTANGTYRSAFVCGSLRVVTALETRIEPTDFLPPAEDVYLVE